MLVILPFWTSFLIRVYAWIGILKPEGFLNDALQALGLIGEPLQIINTPVAVMIGIVYAYLPFMVLPLYATLEKLDPALIEAAQDLGAGPWRAFWRVTLPLSLPGIVAGALLVFIPASGEFVIPDLLERDAQDAALRACGGRKWRVENKVRRKAPGWRARTRHLLERCVPNSNLNARSRCAGELRAEWDGAGGRP
jgi:ABC-type spermidine/putrescine transport system permease subunit I